MARFKIGILMSSTREGRMCDRVTQFVKEAVEKDHDVVIFDPKELELPQTQQSLNFMFNPGAVPQNIRDLNERAQAMDAFIMVCAEYNWSLPPGLTNMCDNIPPTTFIWKPCGFVHYSMGPWAGWRAGMQLRQFAGGIGFTCISKQLGIPNVQTSLDEQGTTADDHLNTGIQELLSQLYWITEAINNQKLKSTPPPFAI